MDFYPFEKSFLLIILGVSNEVPNKENSLQAFDQHLNSLLRADSGREKMKMILVWKKILGKTLHHLAIDIMCDNFKGFHLGLPPN